MLSTKLEQVARVQNMFRHIRERGHEAPPANLQQVARIQNMYRQREKGGASRRPLNCIKLQVYRTCISMKESLRVGVQPVTASQASCKIFWVHPVVSTTYICAILYIEPHMKTKTTRK